MKGFLISILVIFSTLQIYAAAINPDIEAANKAFQNKYKKSTTFECAGNAKGSAKQGYLGWLYVAKGSCLKIEGGFLIKKDEKGKKVVEKG